MTTLYLMLFFGCAIICTNNLFFIVSSFAPLHRAIVRSASLHNCALSFIAVDCRTQPFVWLAPVVIVMPPSLPTCFYTASSLRHCELIFIVAPLSAQTLPRRCAISCQALTLIVPSCAQLHCTNMHSALLHRCGLASSCRCALNLVPLGTSIMPAHSGVNPLSSAVLHLILLCLGRCFH